MSSLSASGLLELWERGVAQQPALRGLMLLAASDTVTPIEKLSSYSIGRRDALILELRERTFGPRVVGLSTCPSCREELEINFNVSDILTDQDTEVEDPISLCIGDYEVVFRLPNSIDLMYISDLSDVEAARQMLILRCLEKAQIKGQEVPVAELDEEIVNSVIEGMAKADSQGYVQLSLSCTCCGHQWKEIFDIVSFFWSEINAWAERTIKEVHLLASAYGWGEREILSMSLWRRQAYLDLVNR